MDGSDADGDNRPGALSMSGMLHGQTSPRAAGHGDEDLMQDFVRMHMMSIFQPFADRMHELQAQVQQLTGDLHSTRELADAHATRLDENHQQLSTLQTGAAVIEERLEKAHTDLLNAKRERTRLDGNHEMTRATVGKTKEMLGQLDKSLATLRESLEKESVRIAALEVTVPEVEKRVTEHMETRLDKQGRVCKDLNERQADILKTCQQAKSTAENAAQALKKLSGTTEQRAREDSDNIADLRERTSNLETKLLDAGQDLRKNCDGLKSIDREVQNLRTWADQVAAVRQLHDQQSELATALDTQGRRLDRAEDDISQLRSDTAQERQAQCSEFRGLEDRLSQNMDDLLQWRDRQRTQADLLTSTGQRLNNLENGQKDLERRAGASEEEIQNLISWRHGASNQLSAHESTLGLVHSDMDHAREKIEGCNTGIRSLQGELNAEREVLAKLGSRLDLCQKYFNGFGKGLQDTHRQIVGTEGGMLPSKMGGGAALPMLPKTPRTPRAVAPALTASPRRDRKSVV